MAKILLYDLEITPSLGWFYNRYDVTPVYFEKYPWIQSLSWKWYGQKKIENVIQPDFKATWAKSHEDDTAIVKYLWTLINEADVVIAHNLKKFDIKKSNTGFIKHGLKAPSPYTMTDTLQVAHNKFGFIGNSLNDLAIQLGVGEKLKITNKEVWRDCWLDDKGAWQKMKRYNNHDVYLLDGIFKKMLELNYIQLPLLEQDRGQCRQCGGKNLICRGYHYLVGGNRSQTLQCKDCGAYQKGKVVHGE